MRDRTLTQNVSTLPNLELIPQYKGAWAAIGYEKSDIVTYAGTTYIANAVTTAEDIPGVSPKWAILIPPSGWQWRGAWSALTPYVVRDAVSYGGRSWYALQPSLNQQPPANNVSDAFWSLLADKGEDGVGTGDMLKAVYDPDADGKVTAAVTADTALAANTALTANTAASADHVAWDNISGKPATGDATLAGTQTFTGQKTFTNITDFGLTNVSTIANHVRDIYIPRYADSAHVLMLDHQDELLHAAFRPTWTTTITANGVAFLGGALQAPFQDNSSISVAANTQAGQNAYPVVIEVDASADPITAKDYAGYRVGLTFRDTERPTGIKVEVWGAGAYVTKVDLNGLTPADFVGGAWVSPEFFAEATADPAFSVPRLRVTLTGVNPLASQLSLQRVILYHASAPWDSGGLRQFNLHVSAQNVYQALNWVQGAPQFRGNAINATHVLAGQAASGLVAVGDVVRTTATDNTWTRAVNTDSYDQLSKLGVWLGNGCVAAGGLVSGLAGLTPGTLYYVSGTPGAVTAVAPVPSESLRVRLAYVALSSSSALLLDVSMQASTTQRGLVELATPAEAAGNSSQLVLTPEGLQAVYPPEVRLPALAGNNSRWVRVNDTATALEYAQSSGVSVLNRVLATTQIGGNVGITNIFSYTVGANTLSTGQVLRLTLAGEGQQNDVGQTLTIYISLGASFLPVFSSSNYLAVLGYRPWKMMVEIWVTGAAAQRATALFQPDTVAGQVRYGTMTADTAVSNILRVATAWSMGSINNVVRCHAGVLEVL